MSENNSTHIFHSLIKILPFKFGGSPANNSFYSRVLCFIYTDLTRFLPSYLLHFLCFCQSSLLLLFLFSSLCCIFFVSALFYPWIKNLIGQSFKHIIVYSDMYDFSEPGITMREEIMY